jgi:hypothetical protein
LNKFSSNSLCDDCEEALEHNLPPRLANIGESIKASHTCTAEQRETLQHYDRKTSFDFYYGLCYHFSTSNGFKEQDLATLLCVQQATRLPDLHALRARNFAVAAREKECTAKAHERARAVKAEKKHDRGYCKECGRELHSTSPFNNLCSDCKTEKNKGKWRHCKECGKALPIVPPLNSDQSGYLRDLCRDCEIKFPAKFRTKFHARYIGGYGAFPEPKDVKLQPHPDYLEVPELGLKLPYNQLQNVQTMTEEKLKASRIFLVGIFAFAWKKRTPYLVITFNDDGGIEQNPVFDVEAISAIQPFLYQQMVNSRPSEPATPQPVLQPVSKEDPMEKLAKLKKMVNAGLITEEDYNTKKAEILARM